MLLRHVALVSQTSRINPAALARAGAALQKQAIRDFGPLWGISATVDVFPRLQDVPVDYWPIIIRDDIHVPGAAGVHLDHNGQPFSLVQYSASWTLTTSHECLEMLADPFGNRLVAGPSVKPGQGRVQYLVEMCDPCEDARFAYSVNGVTVSDFITPHYYDPVTSPAVRYSFTGAIRAPRQVLVGGYLSWRDPATGHWWQVIVGPGGPVFRDLGVLARRGSLRETIDALTTDKAREEVLKRGKAVKLAEPQQINVAEAMDARAMDLQAVVDGLVSGATAVVSVAVGPVAEIQNA